jgi:RNA polymerase sigma factor (sigma-70 family)
MQHEKDLLDKLRVQDRQAQLELRASLLPKAIASCRHVLREKELAENIAEDIWMDFIYQHVDQLKEAKAISSYLRMMTIRRCIRINQWRQKHDTLEEEASLAVGSENEVVHNIDQQKYLWHLDHCLAKLNERNRRVMYMRYFQEMTQEAIGQALDVSKQYVGRVIKTSLAAIRTCLETGS